MSSLARRHQAKRTAPATNPPDHRPPSSQLPRVGLTTTPLGPVVQAKLRIGAANDPREHEADQVADQVMRMPERATAARPGHVVAPGLQTGMPSLHGGGRPLPDAARNFFEPRLGVSLDQVRIHTDSNAHRLNQAFQARAFAHGSDVYFTRGSFDSESEGGKRLLAHELTHVLQQDGRGNALIQRQPGPVDEFAPKGPLEQAREDVANALQAASRKVGQAIANRDNGAPLPPDVFNAYQRFFRGSDVALLDQLKTRIDDATPWIQTMPFDVIPNPVPAGYRDEAVHRAGLAMGILHAAAFQPPLSAADHYIAIYPGWYADAAMRAPKVLHELFHFFPDVQHTIAPTPTEPSWKNARAYQGFVGTLAGLAEGAGITAMFPP